MASTATSILTVDRYFTFLTEQPEPARFELFKGEPVAMSPVGYPHAVRVIEIGSYLRSRLSREKYKVVGGEVAIVIEDRPLTIRAIDVAVLYTPIEPIQGALREPVLLAVEVISPNDQPFEIERKRLEYERFGIQEIWLVYEITQTVHVSQPSRQAGSRKLHFIASAGDVFESILDLQIAVQDLFL